VRVLGGDPEELPEINLTMGEEAAIECSPQVTSRLGNLAETLLLLPFGSSRLPRLPKLRNMWIGGFVMDGDLVTVVVLGYLDVPGYGTYRPGDVTGFEKSVAESLIQHRKARRFQKVPPAAPASSANILPEETPRSELVRAEPTTKTHMERALLEPQLPSPAPSAKAGPVATASSPRLAAAMAFLREVLRPPRPATEVLALARRRGISPATLRRAKRALGVKAQKAGMRAGWIWAIHEDSLWG